MAEGGDDLEAQGDRSDDTQCPANWDDRSTLVFREVRQSEVVSLTDGYQYVDIRVNTQSTRDASDVDGQEERRMVASLSWSGVLDNQSCFSTCTIKVQDDKENTASVVLDKLCRDNFVTLRHFVAMLFREYRSKLKAVWKNPPSFDIVHMNLTVFEYMQDNLNVLDRNFKNLYFEDMQNYFTLDLKQCDAGATGEVEDMWTSTHMDSGKDPEIVISSEQNAGGKHVFMDKERTENAISKRQNQKGNTFVSELEKIEKQIESQRENIEAEYKAKKERNAKMLSSTKLLLIHHRQKKTPDEPTQPALSPTHIQPNGKRDAGDGEDADLVKPVVKTDNRTFQQTTDSEVVSRSPKSHHEDSQKSQQDVTEMVMGRKDPLASDSKTMNRDEKYTTSSKLEKESSHAARDMPKSVTFTGGKGSSGNRLCSDWPLQFHDVHGDNIQISPARTRAERYDDFCKGICFSHRPVNINEKVYVKIVETSISWRGVLWFGFTNIDPASLRGTELPVHACPDLINKPGYWLKTLGERIASKNLLLCFWVSSSGDIKYSLDDQSGIFFSDVMTSSTLWILLDVFGNTCAVEFPQSIPVMKCNHRMFDSVKENSKKQNLTVPKAAGLDTILCFDTSSRSNSRMDDVCLQEMKQMALEFIEGTEDVSAKRNIEENIGVIAFGETTWVKYPPTNDYTKVRENIIQLQLGGKSSLKELLQVTMEFLKERGAVHKIDESCEIGPRLVVFTNNKPIGGSYDAVMQEKDQLNTVIRRLRAERIGRDIVFWMPTGHCDREFLQSVAIQTHGVYIEGGDVNRLYKYQDIQVTVGRILMFMKNQSQYLTGTLSADVNFLQEMFASHLKTEDKILVEMIVKKAVSRGGKYESEEYFHTERAGLPPFGSRVVRGEDWIWNDQDSDGPGTVIGHGDGSHVIVEWDAGSAWKYRYGAQDAYDVKVVTDLPRMNVSDYFINVGCEVLRGPDWDQKHDDEDGGPGSVGVVFMSRGDGTVKVRWRKNGYISKYNYGRDEKVEIVMRDPAEILQEVTQVKDEAKDITMSNKVSTQVLPVNHQLSSHDPTKGPPQRLKLSSDELQQAKVNASRVPIQQQCLSEANLPQHAGDGDCWIWQWLDTESQWQSYSQESNQKMESCYNRRRNGSCLIQREKKSYRVLFKEMEEKCIENNSRRKVQRIRETPVFNFTGTSKGNHSNS